MAKRWSLLQTAKERPVLSSLLACAVTLAGGMAAMDKLSWYWQSHAIAYAAQARAEAIDDQFQLYLQEQREALAKQQGYQEALQQYITQHEAQEPGPHWQLREWEDRSSQFWCCDRSDREQCFVEGLWYACP